MKLSSTLQRFISLVFLVALCGGYAHAQRLIVVGWNIESGGATDATAGASSGGQSCLHGPRRGAHVKERTRQEPR